MLDLADPKADLPSMELPDSLLHTLDLDPKGETMVGIGPDGTLRQWDVALGVVKANIPADPGAGRSLLILIKHNLPQLPYIRSCSEDLH